MSLPTRNKSIMKSLKNLLLNKRFVVLGFLLFLAGGIMAQEAEVNEAAFAIDNFFLFICAVLVLFMQGGFAMLESGMNSAKNTTNVLFKNVMDMSAGILLYYIIGYSLMYPGEFNGYFGFAGFGISEDPVDAAVAGALDTQVDWFFQAVFAATAATIVSGAVAGRMKIASYLIYSVILTGLIYPISGSWKWGGGWLDQMEFYDFAGSIVVHAVGGFAGLAGAIVLGPRIGRFDGEKKLVPHNLVQATLGVIILLIGWFGFNPGSQLAIYGADNTHAVMLIATNTMLAAAAGAIAALAFSMIYIKKPDLTMALNGILGGLVGITANCDSVTNLEAILIGLVAGILVVVGIRLLETLKIDDPVGAWPVHGLCGIWGGLATGIFGGHPMVAQVIGSIAIPVWAFVTMYLLFTGLKAAGILRLSAEEEVMGVDIAEHGQSAYAEFMD